MSTVTHLLKPTLLVGVGGVGCQIADRVYALMHASAPTALHARLTILGFDTDANDLSRLHHLQPRQLIRTSSADTVFELFYAHYPQLASWFVEATDLTSEIRQMTLLDGAGQIRMLSRLAFQQALDNPTLRADIDNAVTGLATHDGQTRFEGPVNVLIVGSLAGGTGSGMVLSVALELNRLLREKGFLPETRGLFLLPDIFIQAARLPVQQIASVLANGYASLRELNAVTLQATGRSPLPVEFAYRPGQTLTLDQPPFTSVVLLDYENQHGGNLGRSLEAYLNSAARAAHVLLFTPIGGRMDSVMVNEVRQRMAAAAQDRLNCFASLGVGAVTYPREAILDYLALRFGQHLLEDNWLALDQAFRREQEQYHQRVQRGETEVTPPERAASYCRHLHQKAQERVRFFRDRYQRVERPATEEDLEPAHVRAQYTTYLEALETQLKERFWSSQAALTALRQRDPLAGDSLNERDDLVNDVRQFERERRRFRAVVEAALEETPFSLFYNLVLGGDSCGPTEWTAYHLQTYVLHHSPHLVQVRYFLYKTLEAVRERRAALDEDKKRKALEALEKTERFDNPKTPDQIESALERALQITESRWPVWLDRWFRRFAGEYQEYFNHYLATLRDYAERALLQCVFERLEQHLRSFVEVLERFFEDLAALRDELQQDINRAEAAHRLGTGLSDGQRYVFASAEAKQQLWEALRQRLAGVSGDPASHAVLTQALYGRFQDEQRQDRWKVLRPFSGKALYREHIVTGFCRTVLQTQHHDAYAFSVIEAVRREAEGRGQPWSAWLTEIVDVVCYQAEPYLALTPAALGGAPERILFWALSPAVAQAIGDEALLETLFKRHNGAQPLVEAVFPDEVLLCVNTHVNLTLQQLRKVQPGSADPRQAALTPPGTYYQAYQALVQRLLDAKQAHPDQPPEDFTPHLDRHWHKPGVLPELFPEHTQAQRARLWRGYALGVALDRLRWTVRYDQPVTVFIDPQHQGTPAGERVVLEAQDDLALVAVLRTQPAIVTTLLDRLAHWRAQGEDAQGQRAATPEQTALYQGLTAPATLARLLRLSTHRAPDTQADTLTAQAVAALFELFREHLEATGTDWAAPEQRAKAAEVWTVQIRAALALLQQPPTPLREETQHIVQVLAEGARARLLEAWVG